MTMNIQHFVKIVQSEIDVEVINWDQNKDEHFRDLARYCVAYVGWLHSSTFDIVYINTRHHIKQRCFGVGIDFQDIDPDSPNAVSAIKERIKSHDWAKWAQENPVNARVIYDSLTEYHGIDKQYA